MSAAQRPPSPTGAKELLQHREEQTRTSTLPTKQATVRLYTQFIILHSTSLWSSGCSVTSARGLTAVCRLESSARIKDGGSVFSVDLLNLWPALSGIDSCDKIWERKCRAAVWGNKCVQFLLLCFLPERASV